jgi:ribonuclease M5
MKPRLREALVVEGRYDKNSLLQAVDAVILETRGFGVFRDRELLDLLRFYAGTRGLVILTDGDGAGFLIRNRLRGTLPPERVKHAYIPDVYGKEKRKTRPSREGKLGVEGMPPEVLLEALRRAGASFEGEAAGNGDPKKTLTKADFYAMGLSGGAGSAEKRKALALRLGFPERMTPGGLLDAVNTLLLVGRLELSFFDAYSAEHPDQQDR